MVAVLEDLEQLEVFAAPTERLEAEVCTLAAQIAAATCRFVLLVGELDRRRAWAQWECRSMAHWLSWKCGLGIVAARSHVRVGRALEPLPRISEEFAAGRLSFSKVRALTRVATPASEVRLVEFAKITTASQLELAIRNYERTRVDADTARAQVSGRRFRLFHEDDGTVTVLMRMPRDAAENFMAGVDAAAAEVPEGIDPDDSAESRRVDAAELLALQFLAGTSERVPTELVVHLDEDELTGEALSPVLARLSCDTAIRVPGTTSTRRRTRTIPIALRRTIEHRDRHCCRFPGCTNRRLLHVHHIIHWAHDGPTNLENCVLLCPFHHRALHEGGWRILGDPRPTGQLVFLSPRGRRVDEVAASANAAGPIKGVPAVNEHTIATAYGEHMHLADAVDALHTWLRREPAAGWVT